MNPEVVWSSLRGYGFRANPQEPITWCADHAETLAAARALSHVVCDGTPRGYRTVERLSRC